VTQSGRWQIHNFHMTTNEKIPWKRTSVEAAAIVGSILLAFAIEAWWEDRQDRESEQIALSSLLVDFEASREELATRVQNLEHARIVFHEFLLTSPEELERLPQAAIERMPSSISTGSTFDPYLGTLDAIAADGRLALVRDRNIRELLSKWTKSINDIEEESLLVRSSSARVRTATELHGGPFLSDRVARSGPPASEIILRASPSIVAELRRDSSYVSAARSHQFAISIYLAELRDLAKILDDVVRVLEQNIR